MIEFTGSGWVCTPDMKKVTAELTRLPIRRAELSHPYRSCQRELAFPNDLRNGYRLHMPECARLWSTERGAPGPTRFTYRKRTSSNSNSNVPGAGPAENTIPMMTWVWLPPKE